MSLSSGTKLGRYEIRSKIGEGGMGEVYLARDTKLDRKVALKVLPAEVAADRSRMSRFVQEAKAASALNHPNILTIYEIDEADSVQFIATEFIDGETLRERIRSGPLSVNDVLDIGAQIAGALSAAHAASIVHRDIKPENIMLRQDGIAKILDFGLAKLTERVMPDLIDTEAPTTFKTLPGTVVGTTIYMSPEQARGIPVDARTDVFSLGIVLYEMVAGCLPFAGSTSTEIVASLLDEKEPQPLARYARKVPAELERIVAKALRKDREQRYQTSKDLWLDLQSLKQQLEFETKLERSTLPELKSPRPVVPEAHPIETISQKSAPSTSSTQPVISALTMSRKVVFLPAAAVLILGLTAAVYFYFAGHQQTTISSIAVLPFVNASADADTEYLSDGITESLINSLSQLPNIKMIASSSVFSYKGKEINAQAIGRELGVQAILTGRVVQHGDNLSISAELVDVQNNSHLWGEQYNRKLADLLTIQSEISLEISRKLRLRLAGEDQKRVTKHYTENTEAYQLYLKGRYYWNKRTAEGIKKAVAQFQQAIDNDPNYALAYAGLADSYLAMQGTAGAPASELLPKAKAATLRALQIDDSLAEAHATLAQIYAQSWQWEEAEEEYRRAIQLNSNYPTAHQRYSVQLTRRGRLDEAMAEAKRAHELDPLSPIIAANVARAYILVGDLEAAIANANNSIELDPNFAQTHETLALAYQKQGRHDEAIVEAKKAVELSGRAGRQLGVLGYCYAVAKKRSEALMILRELEEKYAGRESTAADLAGVYAGLGDKDQAFAWLEKDFQDRSGTLSFQITGFAILDTLRSDARYADLLRRMGLRR
jgi:eukaryotic-like serine/threonine-protein kinase